MTAYTEWGEVQISNSLEEAGEVLRISRSAVYRLVQKGSLEAVKVSDRKTIITKAALRAFLCDEGPPDEAKAPASTPVPSQHLNDLDGLLPTREGEVDVSPG